MSGFHAQRQQCAQGSRPRSDKGTNCAPRLAVSFPAEDMAIISWWAAKKKIPAAQLVRDAVFAYLLCVRADFERETAITDGAPDRPAEVRQSTPPQLIKIEKC